MGGQRIQIFKRFQEIQSRSNALRKEGKIIAFVPTMGYLHDGHLALLREGRKRGDDLILSIFVNPTQFGPGEDLDAYPRSFERDAELAKKIGVDAIFAPAADALYGSHFQTYVSLEKLPNHLCGLSRPVHFRGVATVVTKLFNIVKPHVAIFGQKDFQQLAVIRQMVQDLNLDIEIVGMPTVREADGLAMSSRNAYLNSTERKAALCLYQALRQAQADVQKGETEADTLVTRATDLIRSHPEARIDYIAVCDPDTLGDVKHLKGTALMALAVFVGKTRLIDNMLLQH